jgi:hypothetical protein
MIRYATPHDLQAIIEVGYRLCDRTSLADIPRDRPSIVHTITDCIASQFGCCFVAEHDKKITGVLLGIAQQFWFSRKRQATDLMFTAETPRDGWRLARAFIDWAWRVPGVIRVDFAQSSGIDVARTDKFFKRLGCEHTGGVYSMNWEQRAQQIRRSA